MNINLGPIQVDPRQYGIQGNAILGIKETGKSYFATTMGERLMDAGIPIVALDPIGIWRFLRVAGTGPGFPIVVAGGEHGDLPLSSENATEIMRAALREGISVVFDLYSMELSKADWRKIVEAVVRTLLYENKGKGIRHVFIEEAAEFAPQRVGPDQGRVYAEIEKMARMGGNAQIGYTLVNPRAAEVNKAVLELCDSLFLFRQKGKNAIEGLGKWLETAGAESAKEIQRSLSTLGQGECWAWLGEAGEPVHIKRTPAKRTYHPDRRAGAEPAAVVEQRAVDVSAFVQHMRGSLEKIVAEAKANDPAELKKTIADLRRQLQGVQDDHETTGDAGQPAEPDQAALDEEYQRGFAEGQDEGRREGLRALEEVAPLIADLKEHLAEASAVAADLERLAAELAARAPAAAPDRPRPALPPRSAAPARLPRQDSAAPPRHRSEATGVPVVDDGDLNGPQRKILDGLAELEAIGAREPKRILVANMAGYAHVNSTGFAKALSNLSARGMVAYSSGSTVALTSDGRKKAKRPGKPLTTRDLQERIAALLDGPGRAIFTAVLAKPRGITRADLAQASGYQHVNSAGFAKALSRMHSLGFVEYQPGSIVTPAAMLFLGDRR